MIHRQHTMHDDTCSYDPDFKPLRTGEGLLIAFLDCCGFSVPWVWNVLTTNLHLPPNVKAQPRRFLASAGP